MMDKEFNVKSWALKWLEGSLVSYIRGTTHINMVAGRIRRCIESYGVSVGEVFAIMDIIVHSPAYLPHLSKEEKEARLKPILEELKKMSLRGDEKHG